MPQKLQGSCHCGLVRFTCDAYAPVPYQLCTCTICRKVGGYGGSVNLGAWSKSLEIEGKEHISIYQAKKYADNGKADGLHDSQRSFCSKCSTMLWVYDKNWPDYIHPFASAIDTELIDPANLPNPQPMVVLMTNSDSKPAYVRLPGGDIEVFEQYGPKSLEEWHKDAGVFAE